MGAKVLAVSADSLWCHKAYADSIGITFPLLSDAWGEVGRECGLWNPGGLREHRAVVILDANRIVQYSRLYKDNDVPDMDEVFGVFKELSEGRKAA